MTTASTSRFPYTFEKMLKSIGTVQKVVPDRHSAKDWISPVARSPRFYTDAHFERVLKFLIENEYDFPERREQEVRVTMEETVSNSSFACYERRDMDVELTTHIGESGLVMHIQDCGPGFDHKKKIEERRRTLLKYPDELFLYGRSRNDFPGGAGLSCLLRFPDEYHFNQKGNELAMLFKLQKLNNS